MPEGGSAEGDVIVCLLSANSGVNSGKTDQNSDRKSGKFLMPMLNFADNIRILFTNSDINSDGIPDKKV